MLAAFEKWWRQQRTLRELRAISEHAFAAGWAAAMKHHRIDIE